MHRTKVIEAATKVLSVKRIGRGSPNIVPIVQQISRQSRWRDVIKRETINTRRSRLGILESYISLAVYIYIKRTDITAFTIAIRCWPLHLYNSRNRGGSRRHGCTTGGARALWIPVK